MMDILKPKANMVYIKEDYLQKLIYVSSSYVVPSDDSKKLFLPIISSYLFQVE